MLLIVALVLSHSLVDAHAQAAATGNPTSSLASLVYAGGGGLKLPSEAVGQLSTDDEKVMKVVWQGGNIELPYERIKVLYVSISRPSALVELWPFSSLFLFGGFRDKKAYLSVQFQDNAGKSDTYFFYAPAGSHRNIDALSKRANRAPIYETEEARRRVLGR